MDTRKIRIILMVCMLTTLVACAPQEGAKVVPTEAATAVAPTEAATAVPQPAEKVEVTWLVRSYIPSELKVEQDIITAFEAKHPNIKINRIVAWGDYSVKFDELSTGGTPPDVWSPSWSVGFKEAVVRDLVSDLTPYIERDNYDLSDFLPEALGLFQVDGKVLGLPILTVGSYTFYNKDLFDKAGVAYPPSDWDDTSWNWEAFLEKGKALTRVSDPFSYAKDVFGCGIYFYPEWEPLAWLWGQDFYPDTAYQTGFAEQAYLDNPKVIEAFQAIQDLANQQHYTSTMPEFLVLVGGGKDPFTTQKYAMYLANGWDIRSYKDISLGIAALPYGDKDRRGMVYTDPWALSIKSAHPEEAWTFLKYLASREVQAQWSQQTVFPPVRKSLLKDWYSRFPGMKPEEVEKAFLGGLKYGQESASHLLVNYARIRSTIDAAIFTPLLYNQKKAAELMPAANSAVIEVLQQIKAKYQK